MPDIMPEETMQQTRLDIKLVIGQGSIDPQTRIDRGEIGEAEVDQFVEDLYSDEFDAEVASLIPTKCVDGRSRKDGANSLGANAAGGTFSVVMGDVLTTARYLEPGADAKQHAKKVYSELMAEGYSIGVHDDDHAEGLNCGCGAEDKLDNQDETMPSILRFITDRGDTIRGVIESLGVKVDDETNALIVNNAQKLREGNYATNGKDLRDAATETAGEEVVETLTDVHNEAALVVRRQQGKTLDRAKLAAKYGSRLQAFNLDVPALQKAAEAISATADEANQKFVAMLYYNVATAATLAGPGLRVVVK